MKKARGHSSRKCVRGYTVFERETGSNCALPWKCLFVWGVPFLFSLSRISFGLAGL